MEFAVLAFHSASRAGVQSSIRTKERSGERASLSARGYLSPARVPGIRQPTPHEPQSPHDLPALASHCHVALDLFAGPWNGVAYNAGAFRGEQADDTCQ